MTDRRRHLRLVVMTVTATVTLFGVPATASDTVAAAVPTCRPPAPSVVGVEGDELTVRTTPCPAGAGIMGYEVRAYAGSSTTASATLQVGLGNNPAHFRDLTTGVRYRFRVAATNGSGAGPLSAASAVAVPPFTTSRSFVESQYEDVAGRSPTPDELARDVGHIDGGTMSPAGLVVELVRSARVPRVRGQVVRLYQAYFLRIPDLDGLLYWENAMLYQSRSLAWVSEGFARSAEFRTRYGTLTNRQFVERVYQNVLGRPGEPSGVDFWSAQLDQGKKTRGQLMIGFSESPEYKTAQRATVETISIYVAMVLVMPGRDDLDEWAGRPAELVDAWLASYRYGYSYGIPAPPMIVSGSMPRAKKGHGYAEPVVTSGGSGASLSGFWSAVGALPPGLRLDNSGWFVGTPTQAGTWQFLVKVYDSGAGGSDRQVTITVDP